MFNFTNSKLQLSLWQDLVMILVLEKWVPLCAASSSINWFSLSESDLAEPIRHKNTLSLYQAIPLWGIYSKEKTKDVLEDLEMTGKLNYGVSIQRHIVYIASKTKCRNTSV